METPPPSLDARMEGLKMPIRVLTPYKTYRVPVTQRHIDAGVCHNRRQCMDAQAVNEAFDLGGLGYISVEDVICFTKNGQRYTFTVPRKDRERMAKFDADKSLAQPHTFSMRLISAVPIPPPASRERKDQINRARNLRNRLFRDAGVATNWHPRFLPRHVVMGDEEQ